MTLYPEQLTDEPGHTHRMCPVCKESQCDGLIVDKLNELGEWRRLFGRDFTEEDRANSFDGMCGEKTVGIEFPLTDPRHYDGVSVWFYPCCESFVDRFTNEKLTKEEVMGDDGGE
jgi:hypothetical protein